MRLLVVNPNTSAGVTAAIAAAARAAAGRGDDVVTVGAPFGPALIVDEADARAAEAAVLACVDAHADGIDGIVVASFGDTAVDAIRARVAVPVVGIARAAFLAALAVGDRFSIVSFSPAVVPSMRAIVARYGFEDRLAGIRVLDDFALADPSDIAARALEPLTELCVRTAREAGTALVLGGGPLAGLAARIAPHVDVPVIDGVGAAIALHRALPRGAGRARG